MADPAPDLHLTLTPALQPSWDAVLAAGVSAQAILGEGVAVGGTAAALYAGHRFSEDVDNLLPNLREHFDETLSRLEASDDWKTARTNRPVLILGKLRGIQIGVRQMRRTTAIDRIIVATKVGPFVIPTLDEMIGMKAVLAYQRKAVRDFLDLAALGTLAGDDATIDEFMRLDDKYSDIQVSSVRLEVAKTLVEAMPADLDQVNLRAYRGLEHEWQDWIRIEDWCQRIGRNFGERIVFGDAS